MAFDPDALIATLRTAASALNVAIDMLEAGETGLTEYARAYMLAQLDQATTLVEMQLPEFIATGTLVAREMLKKD